MCNEDYNVNENTSCKTVRIKLPKIMEVKGNVSSMICIK